MLTINPGTFMFTPRFTHIATTGGLVTLCLIFLAPAMAQVSDQETRPQVKAETLGAVKNHDLLPAGEGTDYPKTIRIGSTKTRAQRKAETLQARNSGDLYPAGDSSDEKRDRLTSAASSSKTRADEKRKTLAAAKAHQLIPAGEGAFNAPAK